MTIYPIVGAAQGVAPDSIETAAGVAVPGSGGYSANGLGGGLIIRSSQSTTKDGTRRLLFEVVMNAIIQSSSATNPAILSPLKAHTVITVPKTAADFFKTQAAGNATGPATVMYDLDFVVAVLNVLTGGKSLASLPTTSYASPIARGLLGGRPLDTVNGAYGSAS